MHDRMRSIQLVSVQNIYDPIGQPIAVEALKKVFCTVRSVSLSEWTQAGQLGLSAAYQVIMWSHEYSGEEFVIMEGKRYHVYRQYESGDKIELYLEEMVGYGCEG